jgi:branched-chain amino acid transport system permease protein
MMGGMYAYFVEAIYPPSAFDALYDVAIALMCFMGGLGTLSGPIIGALILEPTQQYFTLLYGENGWYLVIYGALFLVIILLLPRGIVPTISEWSAKRRAARSNVNGTTNGELATVARAQEGTRVAVERSEGAKEVNL